jgi:hypothetical protein
MKAAIGGEIQVAGCFEFWIVRRAERPLPGLILPIFSILRRDESIISPEVAYVLLMGATTGLLYSMCLPKVRAMLP